MTVTCAVEMGFLTSPVNNNSIGEFDFNLLFNTGTLASIGFFVNALSSSVFNAANNVLQVGVAGGANIGTSFAAGPWWGWLPRYFRFQYDGTTRVTTATYSFDGVNWLPYGSYTPAQTGFTAARQPNIVLIDAYTGNNANATVVIDWFKLTTP